MLKKAIIKNDKVVCKKGSKAKFKDFLKTIGISLAVFVAGAGMMTTGLRTFKNDLPSTPAVERAYVATDSPTELTQKDKARIVFPRNGVIKVNVLVPEKKMTNGFKEALYDTVCDYNRALYQINPKYKLELNFNPSLIDMLVYAINIHDDSYKGKKTESASGSLGSLLGTARSLSAGTVNGDGKYNIRIGIDLEQITENETTSEDRRAVIKNVLLHEFGHGFGLDDEYLLNGYEYQTVMSGATKEKNKTLSPSDFKILLSEYSSDDDFENWDNKYEEFSKGAEWYLEAKEDAKFLKENLDNSVKKVSFLKDAQPSDFDFANIDNICFGVEVSRQGNVDEIDTTWDRFTSFCIDNQNVNCFDVSGSFGAGYNMGKANYSSGQVDGMTFIRGRNSFCAKYKDKIVEFVVSKTEGNERYISDISVYDVQDMDKNGFKQARQNAKDFAEKWKTPSRCMENLSNIAYRYLSQIDVLGAHLDSLDGAVYSMDGKPYAFSADTITTSEDKVYSYGVMDEVVVTSSHITLVNTENGLLALNNVVDIKNNNVRATSGNYMQQVRESKASHESQKGLQKDSRIR